MVTRPLVATYFDNAPDIRKNVMTASANIEPEWPNMNSYLRYQHIYIQLKRSIAVIKRIPLGAKTTIFDKTHCD